MALLTSAVRHRLPAVTVTRVRYRVRGWNAPQLDPVRDAEAALVRLLERFAQNASSSAIRWVGGWRLIWRGAAMSAVSSPTGSDCRGRGTTCCDAGDCGTR
jgi:hypothetical protein